MKPAHASQVDAVFSDALQKAVDFLEPEYLDNKAEMDRIAAQNGYRLAGFRLGRAVFTTKPPKQEEMS